MKKLILLLLFPLYAIGQVTSDQTIKSNTNTLIRNATTVTRANHALINDQLTNSKVSRVENNSFVGVNTYTSFISWVNAYTKGLIIYAFFSSNNTGASTVNISSLGAKSIKLNGATLLANDIKAGLPYTIIYDGTDFQLSGGSGGFSVSKANNGLSLSVDTVQLGGTINKPTLIDGKDLQIKTTRVLLGEFGAPYIYTSNLDSAASYLGYDPNRVKVSAYGIDNIVNNLQTVHIGPREIEVNGNAGNTLTIDASGNITMPNTASLSLNIGGSTGTSNQVLTANGSGLASWQTISGYLKADGSIPLTANWDVGAHQIKNALDPTDPQDLATKSYTDAIAQGLKIRNSVIVATTDTLTSNTYANGTLGVGATLTSNHNGILIIDGITLALNDRILVKDESNKAHNGIYTLTTLGTISVKYVLTRSTDNDQSSEIPSSFVFIQSGTINATSGWVVIGPGPFTMGTTDINWTQFNGTNVTPGTGLNQIGTAFNVNTSQNILTLSNLTTKGLVTTTAAGLLGSQHGTGFIKDDGVGNISYDNSTYLTSYTETDPIYSASTWFGTTNNSTNWNTAYSKRLSSASFSTSILTLTLADASTVTASVPTWNQNTTGTALNITASSNTSITSLANLATIGTITSGVWQGTSIADSYISSAANWNIAYTNRITSLTTTGTNGAASLISNVLNIPNYTVSGIGAWSLTNGGTLTGTNNITSNSASQLIFDGTWTATANSQFAENFGSTVTSRATGSDAIIGTKINHTLIANSTSIDEQGLFISPTFKTISGITATQNGSLANGVNYVTKTVTGMSAATYTNVAPVSTSGTGTGATFDIIVASATTFTSIIVHTNPTGSGYNYGETVTFNGSQFGGSGAITIAITGTTNSLGSATTSLRISNSLGDYANITKRYIDFVKADGVTSLGSIETSVQAASTFFNINDASGQLFSSNGTTLTIGRNTSLGSNTFTITGASSVGSVTGTNTYTNNVSEATSPASTIGAFLFSGSTGGFTNGTTIHSGLRINRASTTNGVVNGFTNTTPSATNGTYTNISATGGTGSGANFTITVSGGVVTSVVAGSNRGTGYTTGDVLTCTITGGSVSITLTNMDFAGVVSSVHAQSSTTDAKSIFHYATIYNNETYNITSTQAGILSALYYNPTLTSTGSFNKYGVVVAPSGFLNGYGTSTPLSSSDIVGSLGVAVTTSTGSLSLDATHHTVIITSGTGTYTLPAASGATRRIYVIVNQTGGARTVSSYKDKTGATQTTVGANSSVWLHSDGSTYYQIN